MAQLKVQNILGSVEEDEYWNCNLVRDAAGRSALHAAQDGDPLEEVKRLVEHERSILANRRNWQYTRSLIEAAKRGQTTVAQRLIEAGVDIHSRDKVGTVGSALEQAALNRKTKMVNFLLAATEKHIARDNYSAKALDQAVQDAQHDEVTRLVQAKTFVEEAQITKDKALGKSAGLGDMEIARSLVESGANADAASIEIREPALCSAASGCHLEMVKYLVQIGAIATKSLRYSQITPIRAAASGGNLEIVERLLEVGTDPNSHGALQAACKGGHLRIVERMLGSGASVNGHREETSSPLQEAALGGHLNVVNILLQAGADVNAPRARGSKTALQAAAAKGCRTGQKVDGCRC